MNKFPFTKRRLEALDSPKDGKRVYWYDQHCDGLCLCVTPAGTRTFYLYKWDNGGPLRVPLGRFPSTSIEQARKHAKTLVGEMAKGTDVRAARNSARREQTLGGLWQFWLEEHAQQHKKPKSIREDQRQYDTFLRRWAGRKLSSIKRADVQALHTRVGSENGRYTANRLLALLRAMFGKAANMGFTGPNPAAGIRKYAETKRDRFLDQDELHAFLRAVDKEPDATIRDYFYLALLSGARKTNLLEMRWQDVDLGLGLWRIPDTKSGKPVVVLLTGPARAILEERRVVARGE